MAYVGNNYTTTDIPKVAIDLITVPIVALVSFGTIIGLILLYRWLQNKKLGI